MPTQLDKDRDRRPRRVAGRMLFHFNRATSQSSHRLVWASALRSSCGPWDDLEDVAKQGGYYGLDGRTGHPLLDAPLTGSSGGTVYFDGSPDKSDLDTLLRVLTVHVDSTGYAVFLRKGAESWAGAVFDSGPPR